MRNKRERRVSNLSIGDLGDAKTPKVNLKDKEQKDVVNTDTEVE